MPHRHPAVAADRQAGLDLLEIRSTILGLAPARLGEARLHRLVGTVQRDRGHVPVQPSHLHAEGGDRLGTHRPYDLLELGRDRVQGTADPVVVERCGRDGEDLGDRPGLRPVLHPPQRRRRGQPVGHQRTDDLPMGQGGHLPDRAGAVHDPFKIKPPAEAGHHRQCSQQLLHTGRAVAGRLPARSLSWSLSSHRGMLPDPKPHQHNNPSMFRSIPGPRLRMCGGQD